MTRAKAKATILVPDGAGGMVKVPDRRFEPGDWPIQFQISAKQADTWLRYFHAEYERRGWSSSSIGQFEARDNSGSITVNTGGANKPSLAVVWERRRDRPIHVRARSAGTPEFPLAAAQDLFEEVNQRCRSGAMEQVYRRGQLEYHGLPWCGELWLDDTLRLAPPSRQDETALFGPRIILVDYLLACVGRGEAGYVFDQALQELSVFISVVMGSAVRVPRQGRAWTWIFADGAVDCAVRNLGYCEQDNPQEMPARGASRSMPLRQVNRPDFSRGWLVGSINEESLLADITDLWEAYRSLTTDQLRQFLQAGAKWQEALTQRERSTLSFALMVVACEALKPADPQFRDHNIYDVVEALLGNANAERLREHWFRPQDVRHAHLHRGEFRGSEFAPAVIMSSYYDPTFDEARRALEPITREAIVEWLRRRGTFTMAPKLHL